MTIEISKVTVADEPLMEALSRLLPQLSSSASTPDRDRVVRLLEREDTHLFVARNEGAAIVGMLTLVVVDIPTSRKAWVEDVVTDESCRACGVGRALVERAIEVARQEGVRRLYLTSNPARKAAHRLYERCGFERYDTTLFRLDM